MDDPIRRHALWIARAMGRSGLSPLRPVDVTALEHACKVRRLPAGTLVLAAGDAVERIHIVRCGEVRLTTRRAAGGTAAGRAYSGGGCGWGYSDLL